ncbi:CoA-binding protein [Candidatus Woesearchaeota archaeon]|nr:CoA-binding protein [Candidatus Woesearchaeota archaeon]
MKEFFRPKSIAVIGVSREENKIGHVIFKNLLEAKFKVYPITPNAQEILGVRCYSSVAEVKDNIELAIICVHQSLVMSILEDCNYMKIKNVLIISSGFSEVGNVKAEEELKEYTTKNNIRVIGPNCLGLYDAYSNLDCIFIPKEKLRRPNKGGVSFVCQSGALGGAVLDLLASKHVGFSKFISYGNAVDINESDLLQYLNKDKHTKVICLYVEGIKNPEKFFNICKKIKKPIIVLKGGLTEKGSKAAMSHTGSMAGEKEVFYGIFDQLNLVRVDSLEQMFDVAMLFDKEIKLKGNKILVLTNGGGFGIISADGIELSKNLKMTELSLNVKRRLWKELPPTVNIGNPLDIVGDANDERYKFALENVMNDKNVDCVLVIVLYQTPTLDEKVLEVIAKFNKKPMILVATGSNPEYLKNLNLVSFDFPEKAISALDKLVGYYNKR